MALTKKDIETLKGIFVTKVEFNGFRDDMLSFKDDMIAFKKEMLSFKDQVLTTLDKLMKMLETRREEDIVAMGDDRQRDRRIDDHEKRILTLETAHG